jgi:hypothetical protein
MISQLLLPSVNGQAGKLSNKNLNSMSTDVNNLCGLLRNRNSTKKTRLYIVC